METEIEEVSKRIKEKEETLRKLKMVKLHRSKHDAVELEKLSNQWLRVCQQALQDLQQKLQHQVTEDSNHEYNMRKLLQHLNIEPDLVGYSADEDAFQSLL